MNTRVMWMALGLAGLAVSASAQTAPMSQVERLTVVLKRSLSADTLKAIRDSKTWIPDHPAIQGLFKVAAAKDEVRISYNAELLGLSYERVERIDKRSFPSMGFEIVPHGSSYLLVDRSLPPAAASLSPEDALERITVTEGAFQGALRTALNQIRREEAVASLDQIKKGLNGH